MYDKANQSGREEKYVMNKVNSLISKPTEHEVTPNLINQNNYKIVSHNK